MALSKEKIEQIRMDAEEYSMDWETEVSDVVNTSYKAGATAQAEKAHGVVKSLEDMLFCYGHNENKGPEEKKMIDRATAALQSYTNSLK